MVVVTKQKGESEDKLIARFKKSVLDSGILQEVRDRARHVTKSEKRKEKNKLLRNKIRLEKKRSY